MKRTICRLLLMTMVLAAALPVQAFAASGVDLSRIQFSSGSEPLEFKFGSISMEGEVRQEYPLKTVDLPISSKASIFTRRLSNWPMPPVRTH